MQNLSIPLTNRIIDYGIMYSKYNAAHTMMGLLYDHPLAKNGSTCTNCVQCNYDDYQNFVSKIGGMDEDIPYSYTDCDYCFRLRDIGFETWVSAGAIAYHKGEQILIIQNLLSAIIAWTQKVCME